MISIRLVALAGLSLTVLAAQTSAGPIPSKCKTGGFAIGCQAYTFKEFTAFEAIGKTAQAGGKVIEFYPGQSLSKEEPAVKVGHTMSDADMPKLKAQLEKNGVKAVSYGVVNGKDEAEWRKIFEFAKKMGMYSITTEDIPHLDAIEKLVKEFDLAIGIHNHPKRENDANYKVWDPNYVLSVVKDRDARIGSCADTGHWQTSDVDPLEAVKLLKGHIICAHLKDKSQFGRQGHDVPYGQGTGKIKAVLDQLKAQGFKGNISIEYEYNWRNSLPEVKQCIDFVRDYGKKK
jgi:sugar phosphate isomerase/epimerase